MKKTYKILEICVGIFVVFLVISSVVVIKQKYFEKVVYATAMQEENIQYLANDERYNASKITNENTKNIVTEELEKVERDVEFTTKYIETDKIAIGTIQVLQEGMDGKEVVTIRKTYIDGELTKEEQLETKLVKSQLEKIVQVGKGPASLRYTINEGDLVYVTSNLLAIYLEPDKSSKKIITISKQTGVYAIKVENDWVKVKYGNYVGWAKKECLSKETTKTELKDEDLKDKNEILSNVSENMELNKVSGLSIEQFKKVLTGNSQDKNNVFNENYEYFYYAEKQYNVNGIFLAAVAIHESNWGTSKMAQNKKNLFGYGAYDSNPSNNAYVFNTYAEGIDLLARVFSKYYLNPKGTLIYNNEKASGSHYNGATVSGVNKHYATDKNWSSAVYKWMQYLYNRT
mgnify:FL=1